MAVQVTERVTGRVTELTAERSGTTIKASWKIPPSMTDENRADRAEFLDAEIAFNCAVDQYEREFGEVWSTGPGSAYPGPPEHDLTYTGYDVYWVKGLALGTSVEKPFERKRYHPCSYGRYVDSIDVGVHGGNSSGAGGSDPHMYSALGRGPWAMVSCHILKPREPEITLSYNNGTKKVTATVETDEGKDMRDRYDTVIRILVKRPNGNVVTYMGWTATQLTKWTKSDIDITQYWNELNDKPGKSVIVTVEAYSRGMAGNSATVSKPVTAAYPASTTIKSITCPGKTSGPIYIQFTNVSDPETTVKLQRSSDGVSWSYVTGAEDNGGRNCDRFSEDYNAVNPQPGVKTYYRVECTRNGVPAYSAAAEATCIYKANPPVTCAATVGIPTVKINDNNTNSMDLVLGFTDQTANIGCELTISEIQEAWRSTNPPQPTYFLDTDSPGLDNPRASKAYTKTRTVLVSNLTLGVTYYAKMRRYRLNPDNNNEKIFSNYSSVVSFKLPDSSSAQVKIASMTPDKSGTAATIKIGFNESSDSQGTLYTYSDYENAWESNIEPKEVHAEWARKTPGAAGLTYSQDLYLRELNPSTTYYIKARRYTGDIMSANSPTGSFTTPAKPTASSDCLCGIVSATGGEDGHSAVVIVGWTGSRTGCEISWSDDPNAWKSSEQPQLLEETWTDSWNKSGFKTKDTSVDSSKTYYTRTGDGTDNSPYVYTKVASPTSAGLSNYYELEWGETATVYLSNLTEGVTYYVRARAYHEGDETTYSEYGDTLTVTPISAPKSVVLTAPAAIARGESIECYWTVEGDLDQTEWHVHEENSAKTTLADGEGSLCRAIIPPERYGSASSITFYVSAGCGGGLTDSNLVSVGVADTPSCEVHCPAKLEEQPATFEAYTDDPTASLLATCFSTGIAVEAPDGNRDQKNGEAVWTDSLKPAWTAAKWEDTSLSAALADALDAAETAYADALDAATFAETEDDEVQDGTTYYELVSSDYVAVDPLSAVNPHDEGWYEESGSSYALTSDTSVVSGKNYYTRSGTEGSYTYAVIDPISVVDPSANGWYYVTDAAKALACDNARHAVEVAQAAVDAHPDNGDVYMAEIELPKCDFADTGTYRMEVRAVEPIAGLTSDVAESTFLVDWDHQAPVPGAVTLTVDVDRRAVKLAFAAPASAAETDVYDVYRQTPTGHVLIASGLAMDTSIMDQYAPFGNRHYRVSCRTADGDFTFKDFDYSLPVGMLRIDFGESSVELPWDLELSDSYAKSYGERDHADGSIGGYFEPAVKMSGKYSTGVAKMVERDQMVKLRKLAEYAGACFCRTTEGMAFQCNADVSGLEVKRDNGATGVSISVSAHTMTDEYAVKGGRGA